MAKKILAKLRLSTALIKIDISINFELIHYNLTHVFRFLWILTHQQIVSKQKNTLIKIISNLNNKAFLFAKKSSNIIYHLSQFKEFITHTLTWLSIFELN